MMETELLKEIEEAFASIEYPGDMNLVKNIQYPESYDMFEAFKSKHWHDINIDLAGDWRMNLSNLSDSGFQYFLPAFLLASLGKDPFEVEMFVVINLEPPDDKSDLERFRNRMSLFDKAQKLVIYKYLQHVADEDYPSYAKAGLSFWKPKAE